MRKIFLTTAVLGLTVFLSGCFVTDRIGEKVGEKVMEKTIETQTGGKVDVNSNSGEMNIKTDKGEVNLSGGSNAKLPDNFPSDVFVYDDRQIIISSSSPAEGTFSVSYVTGASVSDAFSKYKSEMVAQGWTNTYEMTLEAGKSNIVNFEKGEMKASVMLGTRDEDGKTVITLTVVKEKK